MISSHRPTHSQTVFKGNHSEIFQEDICNEKRRIIRESSHSAHLDFPTTQPNQLEFFPHFVLFGDDHRHRTKTTLQLASFHCKVVPSSKKCIGMFLVFRPSSWHLEEKYYLWMPSNGIKSLALHHRSVGRLVGRSVMATLTAFCLLCYVVSLLGLNTSFCFVVSLAVPDLPHHRISDDED